MSRPSLLHPLADRRRTRRRRAAAATGTLPQPASAGPTETYPSDYDIAAHRVRDAGGPLDEATYSCACGFVFAASVSTSVCCPHCGAGQAW